MKPDFQVVPSIRYGPLTICETRWLIRDDCTQRLASLNVKTFTERFAYPLKPNSTTLAGWKMVRSWLGLKFGLSSSLL